MTTYFVNKSGNDSNSGLSASAAFLTINRARQVAVSGDIIRVQTGVYSEALGGAFANNAILRADGIVIIDGFNVVTQFLNNTGLGLTIEGFRFQRFTVRALESIPNGAIRDCVFESMPVGFRGTSFSTFTLERCVFTGITSAALDNDLRGAVIKSCTFHNCNIGLRELAGGGPKFQALNCLFKGNTIHIDIAVSAAIPILNGNCYFPLSASNKLRLFGTDYTTLASWQAATGQDGASISADPLFVDDAKGLFGLKSSSPCLVNGLISVADGIIGARNRKLTGGNGVMDGLSSGRNPTIWNPPTGSPAGTAVAVNMIQDGSGNWILAPGQTTGSVTFEMSLVPAVKIGRNFFRQFIFYPLGVFDHLKTDAQPNRLTYEFAVDTGSGFGALTAIEPDSFADDPATGFRDLSPGTAAVALRIKVTARKDGAAA